MPFLLEMYSLPSSQNHWFTYNETMTVESVTQAVSNLALQFGEEDADPGAMVSVCLCRVFLLLASAYLSQAPQPLLLMTTQLDTFLFDSSLVRLGQHCCLEELMKKDPNCKYRFAIFSLAVGGGVSMNACVFLTENGNEIAVEMQKRDFYCESSVILCSFPF